MRSATKAVLAALWTGALILTVVVAVDGQEQARYEQGVREDTHTQLDIVRANTAEALDQRLALADRLAAFVDVSPELDPERFDAYAAALAASSPGVRSLRLVPTVGPALVYPANADGAAAAALGTTAPSLDSRLVGPYALPSGNDALLVLRPVQRFGADAADGLFGTAWAEFYLDPLLGEAKVSAWPGTAVFAIRGSDGHGAGGATFFGDEALFAGRSVTTLITFDGGQWQIAAAPAEGWPDEAPASWWIRLGGGFLALMASILVAVLVSEPSRLRGAVDAATRVARDNQVALRDEKERFRRLAEAAQEGIVIHEDGRILEVNAAFAHMVGEPAHALVGADLFDRVSAATPRHRLLEAREGDVPPEVEVVRRTGETFPAEVAVKRFPYHDRLVHVVAVRDVTERKKAEAAQRVALERLNEIERLKEIDQFKTQLLNTASHELNTPITPIRLQLHLLKNERLGGLSDKHRKAIAVLDRNVERLAHLVQDVLDVARLQSGHLKVARDPIEVETLVREAVEAFEEPARQAAVRLEVDVLPDLWVAGDGHRLTQVLFNLLSNALKFTGEGGRIRVGTTAVDGRMRLRVQDDGLGMDADQIARLFQPFSQVHDTMERTHAGTGLGLYISRGIIEEHGGRIWCESAGPGRGAAFLVDLPLSMATDLGGRDAEGPMMERRRDPAA